MEYFIPSDNITFGGADDDKYEIVAPFAQNTVRHNVSVVEDSEHPDGSDEFAESEFKPSQKPKSGRKKPSQVDERQRHAEELLFTEDATFGNMANTRKTRGTKLTKKNTKKKSSDSASRKLEEEFEYVDEPAPTRDMEFYQNHQTMYPPEEEYDNRYPPMHPSMQMPMENHMVDDDILNSAHEMKAQKAELLTKLQEISTANNTQVPSHLSLKTDLETLRYEADRMQAEISTQNSIKFQRRTLMTCVTMLEWMNEEYKPFDGVNLKGWSETVLTNVEEYNNVFLRLHEKYKNRVNVSPEMELIMLMGGSALMFSVTQSMVKSNMGNMGDVMKQNPELMEKLMRSMAKSASEKDSGPAMQPQRGDDSGGNNGGGSKEYQIKGPASAPMMDGMLNSVGLQGTPGLFPPTMGNVDYNPMPQLLAETPKPDFNLDLLPNNHRFEDDEDDMKSQASGSSRIITIPSEAIKSKGKKTKK